MSNLREKYAVDRGATSVVRIDDAEITVRSASSTNRDFTFASAVAADKVRDDLRAGGVRGMSALEDVLIEAFAETVIVGWTGVDGDDGQPLPFNKENCVALLQDCPQVWDEIKAAARDESRFKPSTVREDGEHLGKS